MGDTNMHFFFSEVRLLTGSPLNFTLSNHNNAVRQSCKETVSWNFMVFSNKYEPEETIRELMQFLKKFSKLNFAVFAKRKSGT